MPYKKPTKQLFKSKQANKLLNNPLFWIILGLIAFATYHYGMIWLEKRQFEKLDKQAYQYIQSINQKYPGKFTHEKYCDYSSEKFSRGSLGCNVNSEIVVDVSDQATLIQYAEMQKNKLNWGKGFDNTPNDENSTIMVYVYNETKPSCDVTYTHPTHTEEFETVIHKSVRISAGCSGNARAEHYPVREYY